MLTDIQISYSSVQNIIEIKIDKENVQYKLNDKRMAFIETVSESEKFERRGKFFLNKWVFI